MEKEKVLIGWGSRDVTPKGKVSLRGQFHVRISDEVHDPLTTTALALEGEQSKEQAIIVSLDAVCIADEVLAGCRNVLADRLTGFSPDKLVISATHTHTAPEQPGFILGPARDLGEDVLTGDAYGELLIERISAAAIEAWEGRKPGALSWGRGYAVVGFNRRVAYFDGSSVMYGKTDDPAFSHIEGHEDHGVDMLFTYDQEHALTGMVLNVPCPSQCTEQAYFMSADYWHETRETIRTQQGEDLHILPQCSAAGDLSPRTLIKREADARMLRLKGYDEDYNTARRQDIADKLAAAVNEALPLAAKDIRDEIEFGHDIIAVDLPERIATQEDLQTAQDEVASWQAKLDELKDEDHTSQQYSHALRRVYFNQKVIDMYAAQQEGSLTRSVELHALRIGDTAMCTNRFEYYLDFGERIKARSKALQTFVVQLAGSGWYLPTERAMQGGSYGAYIASTPIGPEGGQLAVEETLKSINSMWE